MTSEEVKQTVENIVADLDAVSTIAAGVAPELIPFIAIGQAVDKILPGLASQVTKWIEGNPPTAEEKQTLVQQLSVLDDPDLP